MVFETALVLSVANPIEILTYTGLGLGSLMFIFINWNQNVMLERFFSIENWKNLFKSLLEWANVNEKIFMELCRSISQSITILEQQGYKNISGGLKEAFNDLNDEMESMQTILMQFDQQMFKMKS